MGENVSEPTVVDEAPRGEMPVDLQKKSEELEAQAKALATQTQVLYDQVEKVLKNLELLKLQSKGHAFASNVTLDELLAVIKGFLGLLRIHEMANHSIQTSLYHGQLGNGFVQELLIEVMIAKGILKDREELDVISARYAERQAAIQKGEDAKIRESAFDQAVEAGQKAMEEPAGVERPSASGEKVGEVVPPGIIQFPGSHEEPKG